MMYDYLNKTEYELAKSIIIDAFENSALAFERFLGKKVKAEFADFTVQNPKTSMQNVNENFVLISELKGDIRGKCYLVFTKDEANKLFKNCLTAEYSDNESMQNAILMELDNILTAAVVTVFSDKLKLNSYAYVPKLLKMTSASLEDHLESDFNFNMLVLNFKTSFKIHEITLSPEFIWAVELKFLEKVNNKSLIEK